MPYLRRPQPDQIFQPWMISQLVDELERLGKLTGDSSVLVDDGPEGFTVHLATTIAALGPPQLFINVLAPILSGSPLYPWVEKDWVSGAFVTGAGSGTPVAAPSTPGVSNSGAGGTILAGTYYVVIAYETATGPTNYSPQASTTTAGSTSTITVTSPSSVTGATGWLAYVGTRAGGPYFLQGGTNTLGTNFTLTIPPVTNTAQASNNHNAAIEINNFYTNPGLSLIVPAWYVGGGSQVIFQVDYCSRPVGS